MPNQTANKRMRSGNNYAKLGAGLGVIASAAAAYYFFGKAGKEHRKQVKDWVNKAKKEVISELKGMKEVTEEVYREITDEVLLRYEKFKEESPEEYEILARELRGHWERIKAKTLSPSNSNSNGKKRRNTKKK